MVARERGRVGSEQSDETERARRATSIPPPAFPATAHTVAAAPPPWHARVHMRDCARAVSRDHLSPVRSRRRDSSLNTESVVARERFTLDRSGPCRRATAVSTRADHPLALYRRGNACESGAADACTLENSPRYSASEYIVR